MLLLESKHGGEQEGTEVGSSLLDGHALFCNKDGEPGD